MSVFTQKLMLRKKTNLTRARYRYIIKCCCKNTMVEWYSNDRMVDVG